MNLRVRRIEFFRLPMRTRFPFRYGIASMTELPHLLVRAMVETEGKTVTGVSSDGLPPKWFTKDPDTDFQRDDLPAMLRVIGQAADVAVDLKTQPSVFAWWRQLDTAQHDWAIEHSVPPLLAGFGVSLIERAVIDACCRASGHTLFQSLRENHFAIELGAVRDSLKGWQPESFLADAPLPTVRLRHTVGLGDPLTGDDVDLAERPDDGLPYTLTENIRAYQLDHFKIKLSGDLDRDRDRLERLASLIDQRVGPDARVTLDGNEQYGDIDSFRVAWGQLRSSTPIRQFLDQSLLFVEQPLHRDRALDDSVQTQWATWPDAPPIIIDESDATLASLPTALRLGYAGTSHKNCKGILKGLVGAATIAEARDRGRRVILSAEDLANVGPVAFLQDLAMVSALSISHVERNGHHYFAGLSMFPEDTQRRVVDEHSDLYRWHESGFAALSPVAGRLELGSVNRAPFGVAEFPDLEGFQGWEF